MISQAEMDFNRTLHSIERGILIEYPEIRRIWIEYNRPSKKEELYNLVITIFRNNQPYTMLFPNNQRIVTLETISQIIKEYLGD